MIYFLIPKDYKLYHKLLEYLYEREMIDDDTVYKSLYSVENISKHFGITFKKAEMIVNTLEIDKSVKILQKGVICLPDGSQKYKSQYYLKTGWDLCKNDLFKFIPIIISILSLAISTITYISNIKQKEKIKALELQKLQQLPIPKNQRIIQPSLKNNRADSLKNVS